MRIFFANSIERHISDVKNLRLRHYLPISINESDFAISQGFNFHETSHMRSFAKIKSLQKFPNLQYMILVLATLKSSQGSYEPVKSLDSRLKGPWFETLQKHCVVSLSKTL